MKLRKLMDLSCDCLLKYKQTFVVKLIIVQRVPRGKLENYLAIVGLDTKFWDLAAIPGEQLGSNLVR
jgi:hypothetical protein